jgi:outer membrane protein assembly factor BamB
MRKSLALSVTLGILFGFLITIGPQEAGAFMFRGDILRSGVYDSKAPENNTLLWSFDAKAPMDSSVVVSGDVVYFGCEDNNVYCLYASNGSEKWNFTTGNIVSSTPAVVEDVVYVGSTDRKFYAIDADTKKELWNYSLPGFSSQIISSPAYSNGIVFFGADDGTLYALNITTHDLEWEFPTGDWVQSSPAVDWPYVYVGSVSGKVFCVWANNGTEKWVFEPPRSLEFYSTPTISNNALIIGGGDYSNNGSLFSLDCETGEVVWTFYPPGEGRYYEIYSSAAVHNGSVFIHTWYGDVNSVNTGMLYALPEIDPNGDGNISLDEIIWEFPTYDFEGGSSPSVADNKVFVGSTNGKLYCLDEFTGQELWNLTTGGIIHSSPTISDGVVYITSRDGSVYTVGSPEEAFLEVEIIPEFPSIKSNRVMGISFVVTYRGKPVEGAFINFDVDFGNLSQSGASTFGDGSQRIKYTAPFVSQNTTVTVYAKATKSGYPEGNSTAQFVVEPHTSYEDVKSGSTFSLSKYWIYIIAIFGLILLNVIIVIIGTRKRNRVREETKIDEKSSD